MTGTIDGNTVANNVIYGYIHMVTVATLVSIAKSLAELVPAVQEIAGALSGSFDLNRATIAVVEVTIPSNRLSRTSNLSVPMHQQQTFSIQGSHQKS